MNLFDLIKTSKVIPPFLEKKGHFVVDDNIGLSLLLTSTFKQKKEPYIVLTNNLYTAQKIYDYLSSFLSRDIVYLYPSDELIRAEAIASSKELLATRLYVLSILKEKGTKIIVTNVASFLKYLPNPELFYSKILTFKVGGHYDITKIKSTLIDAGYTLVNKIDQTLQFAIRGDILDIYSVNMDNPIRIEFFDDEIESIRVFDIASQTSISKIEKIEILPAKDFLLSKEEKNNAGEKIRARLEEDQHRLSYDIFTTLRDITETDIENIMLDIDSPRLNRYFPLLTTKPSSLLDYAPNYNLLLVNYPQIKASEEMMKEESWGYYEELFEAGKLISHLDAYYDLGRLISFHSNPTIQTSTLPLSDKDYIFEIKNVPYVASKTDEAIAVINAYLTSNHKVVICLAKKEHYSLMKEMLDANHIRYEEGHDFDLPKKEKVILELLNLPKGFTYSEQNVVFLTSKELFNERVHTAKFDARFKEATILKSFEDLTPGDYVVHEYQGIGQFIALETIEMDGVHQDYLKIAYAGDEILYVPLAQFQLVRKYLGKEGLKPRLSHLHSKSWENTKKRIKERIKDLANRLFNLYVERKKVVGIAFPKDDEIQQAFEDACPFELTEDQKRAVKEIKEDMEAPSPMDRLLCGDVGFGKTEVAFEAIFKAINAGKQVALLCPTTLLARQHFERAVERFSPFDIKIALFSRFVSKSKQKEYILGLKNGSIHLAIGTHRLLSKEIEYNDLGLLVIDEEQRFGVEHKEKIKELKNNIDVLTLSATPIPRTLQISLLGVRSMSIINTPPRDRMPVQTYVLPFARDIAKELIQRELGRGGQVFYLNNNVSNLALIHQRLKIDLPDVSIAVAHGQMNKDDLEETMEAFYRNEISVLICTSIIENGIDIPNVNMIIVEDSDHYGLSQLYQIKGRVGRSDRIAYAYLMYNGNKVLTEHAVKRLEAIQDFTELGSGYKIAQRDLMIRGAGDILGPEQAGFIDSIGLDMYLKLLNEAVNNRKQGLEEVMDKEPETYLTLGVDAYIPEDYAIDADKIELYQEILSASSTESLVMLKRKIKDIYGPLPESVQLLFVKRNIDLLIKESEVESVKDFPNFVEINVGEPYVSIKGIGNMLFEGLLPFISKIKVSYLSGKFKILLYKKEKWLQDLEAMLVILANIKATNKIKVIK